MPDETAGNGEPRGYRGAGAERWLWLAPLVATVVAYRTSPGFGLVADAVPLISENPWMRDLRNLWAMLVHDYFWSPTMGGIGYWRPLTKGSWLIETVAGGGNPAVYHFVQVAWLLIAVSGVYALARATDLRPMAAAAAATLFGLHPALVEPACLVMARSDIVACAGLVWCLAGWRRWTRTGARSGLALHLGALCVALASKEVAVTALPFVALWAAIDRGRDPDAPAEPLRARLTRTLAQAAPAAVTVAVYLLIRARIVDGHTAFDLDPWRVCVSLGRYFWATLPLTFDSPVRNIPSAETHGAAAVTAAAGAAATWVGLLVVFARRGRRDVVALLVLAPLTLGPVLVTEPSVPGVEDKFALADRWVTTAVAAMSIVWVSLVDLSRSPRLRRWTGAAVAAWAVGVLAIAPATHAPYADALSLLTLEDDALAETPERYHTQMDRCRAALRGLIRAAAVENVDGAVAAHTAGQRAGCDERELDLNLLALLVRHERWREAEPVAAALAADPPMDREGYRARLWIGLTFLRAGRADQAIPWLEEAAAAPAVECATLLVLAEAREQSGRPEEAGRGYIATAECLIATGRGGAGPVLVRAAELLATTDRADDARRAMDRAGTMPLPGPWQERLDALVAPPPDADSTLGDEP